MSGMDQPVQPDLPQDPLGPFEPPPDYRFEPEFEEPPPRSIPAELHTGRFARGRRRVFWGVLLAGLLMLFSSQLPIMKTWGLYLLPLQYLDWIGLGTIALDLAGLMVNRFQKGPFRYVEEGVPVVVRIRDLALQVKLLMNGQPSLYHFVALLEYRDPQTQELVLARTCSNEISAHARDHFTTSYQIGDYATAVYLPSNPAKTLRLYGFLELSPGLGVIRRDGAPQTGLLGTLLVVCAVFAMVGVLGWNLYALKRYEPLEGSFAQQGPPFIISGLLLGGVFLALLLRVQAGESRRRRQRNEEALATGKAVEIEPGSTGWLGVQGFFLGLILLAGLFVLGGILGLCLCLTANAWLDNSEPTPQLVRIDNFWQTTHNGIFREYSIEYHFPDEANVKHKQLSTPAEMDTFTLPLGTAVVRTGRFGWTWVETIKPVGPRPRRGPDAEAEQK